jgi:hypothetical protein
MTQKLTLKKGDRIKITLEGTVDYDTESDDGGLIDIAVLWDGIVNAYDYTDISDIPVSAVEIIKPPLAEGLYYYSNSDKPVSQLSLVYKHQGGKWYDNRATQVEILDEEIANFVPLVVGER